MDLTEKVTGEGRKMNVKDHNKLNIRTVFSGWMINGIVKLADS